MVQNFLTELRSIDDAYFLEKMKQQLVSDTFDMNLDWNTRLTIFKKIETVIKRIAELDALQSSATTPVTSEQA